MKQLKMIWQKIKHFLGDIGCDNLGTDEEWDKLK